MERVRVLIQKLGDQSARNEEAATLLETVRQLTAELEALAPRPVLSTSGRVAVMLPSGARMEPPASPAPRFEVHVPDPQPAAPEPLPQQESPVAETVPAAQAEIPAPPPAPPLPEPRFNPIEDVPTLAQQAVAEPANAAPSAEAPSLHEKLKKPEPELAHRLGGAPIKDLRKGIGINDRFLFLAELFRGDETMYERSIKTINGFSILPEAEYWINRELKVKLGWDDSVDTVQHFYALVRRRFS